MNTPSGLPEHRVVEPAGWTGSPLPDGLIGMALADSSPPVLAVTTQHGSPVWLPTDRWASFVRSHSERTLVSPDVPSVFRKLSEALRPRDPTAVEILWHTLRQCRWIDWRLMKQRDESVWESHYAKPIEWPPSPGPPLMAAAAEARRVVLRTPKLENPDYCNRWLGATIFGPYGLFGVGIDVQAAVAVADAGNLELDAGTLSQLDRELTVRIDRSSDFLQEHAYDLFSWKGKRPEIRDGRVTVHEEKLRTWLSSKFSELRDRHDRPFSPPREHLASDELAISLFPSEWGHLARCHRHLRAWRDLVEAASLQGFLGRRLKHIQQGRLQFLDKPRLIPTTRYPKLDFLREVLPGATRPSECRHWIAGELVDIELRCFVAVCAKHASEHQPSGGPLMELVRRSNVQAQSAADGSILPAMARLMADDFQGYIPVTTWPTVVKVLAFGLTRWLASTHVGLLLSDSLGTALPASQVERLAQAFLARFPDVETLYADHIVPDYPELRNDELSPSNMSMIRRAQYLPGRLGMSGIHTQAWIHEFLELADSVMKHVVFELVAQGYRLVAYCGEEFVVEVDDPAHDAEQHVAGIARRAAETLISDLPFPCHCRAVDRW